MTLACIIAAEGHSWCPHVCCQDNDCKPVPCNELIQTRDGLTWRGLVYFSGHMVMPSQDQFCHVCVEEYVDMVPYVPLCVFVPPTC
jgi:hypothetical protein